MTDLSPETVERMVALVRDMLRYDNGGSSWCLPREVQSRVRAIATELSEPVDPDLVEAREIMAGRYPHTADMIREGMWDGNVVADCLEGIKRGRTLATSTTASDQGRSV